MTTPPPSSLPARVIDALRRRAHAFRHEQLMPSILFDNQAWFDDLGLTLGDIEEERRNRRNRGR